MAVGTPGALRAVPAGAGASGQGVAYPLTFDQKGRLVYTSGTNLVQQALMSILQTQPGERPMEPDYGGAVMLFEPIDLDRIRYMIDRSLQDHEQRLTDYTVDVKFGSDPSEMVITLTYRVVGEATPRVLTYPFYIGPSAGV